MTGDGARGVRLRPMGVLRRFNGGGGASLRSFPPLVRLSPNSIFGTVLLPLTLSEFSDKSRVLSSTSSASLRGTIYSCGSVVASNPSLPSSSSSSSSPSLSAPSSSSSDIDSSEGRLRIDVSSCPGGGGDRPSGGGSGDSGTDSTTIESMALKSSISSSPGAMLSSSS